MKKFINRIATLFLAWKHKGKFVWVDGKYNSITLSHQLYKHLLIHTKDKDNQVFVFRVAVPDGWRYCFAAFKNVEPVLGDEVVTNELQLSPKHYFVGFATDQVANILHEYNLSPSGVNKVFVLPKKEEWIDDEGRVLHKYIYYELQPHKHPFIPRF